MAEWHSGSADIREQSLDLPLGHRRGTRHSSRKITWTVLFASEPLKMLPAFVHVNDAAAHNSELTLFVYARAHTPCAHAEFETENFLTIPTNVRLTKFAP